MTHDTGFAPNPFWGELTLATCKPLIRRYKKKGDWIAGFTSIDLCGDQIGDERLVYLMKCENKVSIADYFLNPRYKNKIPDSNHSFRVYQVGDNVYRPIGSSGGFEQIPNENHDCGEMEEDLSGQFVLTSTEFVYFGSAAIVIPVKIRPSLPPGQHPDGYRTHDEEVARHFVEHVLAKGSGVLAAPHSWPADDLSWQEK